VGFGLQVDLGRSRRARQLRHLSVALTGAVAVACLAAWALAPSLPRAVAVMASMAAIVVALLRPAARLPSRLVVTADGTVHVADGAKSQSAIVGYCGEQLICLRTADGPVQVWFDALQPGNWRRLLVACRWPRAREQTATRDSAN
jgi:hypothetical protein